MGGIFQDWDFQAFMSAERSQHYSRWSLTQAMGEARIGEQANSIGLTSATTLHGYRGYVGQ